MNRNSIVTGLFSLLVISLVLPIELDIKGSVYTSINIEDVVILAIFSYFLIYTYSVSRKLEMKKKLFYAYSLLTIWITVTVVVASLRYGSRNTLSVLWLLKWYEAGTVLVAATALRDRVNKKTIQLIIILLGVAASLAAIAQVIDGRWRARIFFGNPNALATFFVLAMSISVTSAFRANDRAFRYPLFIISMLMLTGIFITGSRSGVLSTVVALAIILRYNLDSIPDKRLLLGSVPITIIAARFVDNRIFVRLTSWIKYDESGIELSDSPSARSIRIRIERLQDGIELFISQPVFGYGWFAVPSRLPFLDIHYTTLLAELGVVGFALYLYFYLIIFRNLRSKSRQGHLLGTATFAWFSGTLVQMIAGNFLRAPVFLIFLFILLSISISD